MSEWGENIKISVFGESHSEEIGADIQGFPAGIALDFNKIALQMHSIADAAAFSGQKYILFTEERK